jgi:hypothetical protein
VPLSPVPPVSAAGRLARCVRVGELAGSAP